MSNLKPSERILCALDTTNVEEAAILAGRAISACWWHQTWA